LPLIGGTTDVFTLSQNCIVASVGFQHKISVTLLSEKVGNTEIRAQISVPEGQKAIQAVATSEGTKTHKTIVNGGVCLGLVPPVAVDRRE